MNARLVILLVAGTAALAPATAHADPLSVFQPTAVRAISVTPADVKALRGLPPLEAFGLGCPVIAADVPGASEQLGDAAIRVNPANDLEIAQALKSLFHDKVKREELIRRGKERARRFTGRDFAKGLFDLLDEFEPVRRSWAFR